MGEVVRLQLAPKVDDKDRRPVRLSDQEVLFTIRAHLDHHWQRRISSQIQERHREAFEKAFLSITKYLHDLLTAGSDNEDPILKYLYDGFMLAKQVDKDFPSADIDHHWVRTFKLMMIDFKKQRAEQVQKWVLERWPTPPFAEGDRVVLIGNEVTAYVQKVDHDRGRVIVKYEWETPGSESAMASGSSYVCYEDLQPGSQP